jgi:hypothetical protein
MITSQIMAEFYQNSLFKINVLVFVQPLRPPPIAPYNFGLEVLFPKHIIENKSGHVGGGLVAMEKDRSCGFEDPMKLCYPITQEGRVVSD